MPNKQAADIVVNAEILREHRKLKRNLKRLQQCQEVLSTLVYWHDKDNGRIDESWWDAARKLCPPIVQAEARESSRVASSGLFGADGGK